VSKAGGKYACLSFTTMSGYRVPKGTSKVYVATMLSISEPLSRGGSPWRNPPTCANLAPDRVRIALLGTQKKSVEARRLFVKKKKPVLWLHPILCAITAP
jgi:hypothetical protein